MKKAKTKTIRQQYIKEGKKQINDRLSLKKGIKKGTKRKKLEGEECLKHKRYRGEGRRKVKNRRINMCHTYVIVRKMMNRKRIKRALNEVKVMDKEKKRLTFFCVVIMFFVLITVCTESNDMCHCGAMHSTTKVAKGKEEGIKEPLLSRL